MRINKRRSAEKHTIIVLKQAGEQRKGENQIFQQSVMDQRATVNILNKAQGEPPV